MSWSITGNQLNGIFRGDLVWKSAIELNGSGCTAKVQYEPPVGRSNYLLRRLTDNEPVIIASIVPQSVKCLILPVTAHRPAKTP